MYELSRGSRGVVGSCDSWQPGQLSGLYNVWMEPRQVSIVLAYLEYNKDIIILP